MKTIHYRPSRFEPARLAIPSSLVEIYDDPTFTAAVARGLGLVKAVRLAFGDEKLMQFAGSALQTVNEIFETMKDGELQLLFESKMAVELAVLLIEWDEEFVLADAGVFITQSTTGDLGITEESPAQ